MNRIWKIRGGINITASCDLTSAVNSEEYAAPSSWFYRQWRLEAAGSSEESVPIYQTRLEAAGSSEVSVLIYQTRRRQRVLPKCLFLSTRLDWRQRVLPKCLYLSTRLDGGSGFFRSVCIYLPDYTETAGSSEVSVPIYQTTLRRIPKGWNLHCNNIRTVRK
jgi:hypothetical protein